MSTDINADVEAFPLEKRKEKISGGLRNSGDGSEGGSYTK